MKKNCCWGYYKWFVIHIRDKVKVVLDLSNYATKNIEHATSIDASDLAANKIFTASKPEVDKLDINNVTYVPTPLNNLQMKVGDLNAGRLKMFL